MKSLYVVFIVACLTGCSDAAGSSDADSNDASVTDDSDASASSSDDASVTADLAAPVDAARGCPPEMAQIGALCVDRWEAHVVELDAAGNEKPHSPYYTVDGLTIRAKSAPNVVPQGYISQVQATQACKNAGKRLCAATEFSLACRGLDSTNLYPYGGSTRHPGWCNEGKGSSVARFFGTDPSKWTYAEFNDPRLNQWDGGLAATASYPHCVSPTGVWDCVGNLHEWGSDAADANGHGRFRGGFYGDAEINGHGCAYVTSAHELAYHDYSTGFRCCADAK